MPTGDPCGGLCWVRRTTKLLAQALTQPGFSLCNRTAARLPRADGFALLDRCADSRNGFQLNRFESQLEECSITSLLSNSTKWTPDGRFGRERPSVSLEGAG